MPDGPCVAVLVIVVPRRGRAEALTPVVLRGFDFHWPMKGTVNELAVLAGAVLEEQQIRELDELREEQAHDDRERCQRPGPNARAPAETAQRRATDSRTLIHRRRK